MYINIKLIKIKEKQQIGIKVPKFSATVFLFSFLFQRNISLNID